jgi:hypothetical protein
MAVSIALVAPLFASLADQFRLELDIPATNVESAGDFADVC